jgi:type IV secretion system protein TrbI
VSEFASIGTEQINMTIPSGPTGSPQRQRRRLLGRRYNKRVGIVATGVAVVVIGTAGYAAYENGQRAAERRAETSAQPQPVDATGILKDAPSGYIPAQTFHPAVVWPPIKVPKPAPAPAQVHTKTAKADDNGLEAERKKAWARYWSEYDDLQKTKADNFGSARKAKTSISLATGSGIAGLGSGAGAGGGAASPASNSDQDMTADASPFGRGAGGPGGDRDDASQTEKQHFIGQRGDTTGQNDVLKSVRKAPPSPYAVMAGSYIPAILETAANSDTPGLMIMRVNSDVDDSRTGQCVIIPAGSKLIASYDSQVSVGQSRLPAVVKRIIYPDTTSADIGAMEAADQSGAAGIDADVDRHFWERLGNGLIIGISGVGSSLFQTLPYGGAFAGPTAGAVNSAADLGLNVPPTLTADPGTRLNVVTGQDLTLRPWSCNGHHVTHGPTILTGDDDQ